MRRIITLVVLALILSACSKPATPTSIPSTATVTVTAAPPTLSAPVVSAPAFTAIHMLDINERMGNHGYRRDSDE